MTPRGSLMGTCVTRYATPVLRGQARLTRDDVAINAPTTLRSPAPEIIVLPPLGVSRAKAIGQRHAQLGEVAMRSELAQPTR